MNRKNLSVLVFAAVVVLLCISFSTLGINSLSLITLPFVLAAKGLRALSLSGTVGNILAILLFAALGLLPLLIKVRKKWHREDLLLPLCSMAILYALYYLINPGLRAGVLGGSVGELVLCGTVWSVLLCWSVIKLMQQYNSADTPAVHRALEIFLSICAAERALAVVLRFFGFLSAVETVASGNTMPGLDLTPTYVFLFLSFAVDALEYGLNAFVLLLGAKLVGQLRADPYSSESEAASGKASLWCKRSLVIITASNMALNLGQVLFASRLHNLAAQFSFPILSMAIVFALLVLSGLLSRGRELKEDNDLFI